MSRSGRPSLRRGLFGYRRSDVDALLAEEARALEELCARTQTLEAGIDACERALAETRREAEEARMVADEAAKALRLVSDHLDELDDAARSERRRARRELRRARARVRELRSLEAELARGIELAVRRARALVTFVDGSASGEDLLSVVRIGLLAEGEGSELGADAPEGGHAVARLDSITDELSRLTERLGGASEEFEEAARFVLRRGAGGEENLDRADAPEEAAPDAPGPDLAGRLRSLEEHAGTLQALEADAVGPSEKAPDDPSAEGGETLRLDVGPVEDFDTLTRFMDAVDHVEGVRRVTIERFSERRAVLVVEVGGSIDLLAELTQLASVRIVERGERGSGATVVDLADRDAGKAA